MEIITFNLCSGPCREVHKYGDRKLRRSQISEGLKLLMFAQFTDAFAFDDDIAAWHTHHEIHFNKRLQRFALEDRMMLIFLDYIKFLRLQTEKESLLINIFGKPGSHVGMNVVHTTYNGIDIVNECLTF